MAYEQVYHLCQCKRYQRYINIEIFKIVEKTFKICKN